MHRSARRVLAVFSAAAFAGASLAVAAPAASAIQIKSVGQAHYVAIDDLAPHHFDAIEDVADQINDFLPGEEEMVFAVNKPGPKSAIGIWNLGAHPGMIAGPVESPINPKMHRRMCVPGLSDPVLCAQLR